MIAGHLSFHGYEEKAANDALPDLRNLCRAAAEDLAIMAQVEAPHAARWNALMAAQHLLMLAAEAVEPGLMVCPEDMP